MRIYWNTVKEISTNKQIRYEYKDEFDKRYYSFDDGKTWNKNKVKAYEKAKENSAIVYTEQIGTFFGFNEKINGEYLPV